MVGFPDKPLGRKLSAASFVAAIFILTCPYISAELTILGLTFCTLIACLWETDANEKICFGVIGTLTLVGYIFLLRNYNSQNAMFLFHGKLVLIIFVPMFTIPLAKKLEGILSAERSVILMGIFIFLPFAIGQFYCHFSDQCTTQYGTKEILEDLSYFLAATMAVHFGSVAFTSADSSSQKS